MPKGHKYSWPIQLDCVIKEYLTKETCTAQGITKRIKCFEGDLDFYSMPQPDLKMKQFIVSMSLDDCITDRLN